MGRTDRSLDFELRPPRRVVWRMVAVALLCFAVGFGGKELLTRASAQDNTLAAIDSKLADLNQSVLDVASKHEAAEATLDRLNRAVAEMAPQYRALLERLNGVSRLANEMANKQAQILDVRTSNQAASDPMAAVAQLLQQDAPREWDPYLKTGPAPAWRDQVARADSPAGRMRRPMPVFRITERPIDETLGLDHPLCNLCHVSQG